MKITKNSKIGFDSTSLLLDGERFFPVMGEMHFSRYPKKYWEQELCKMKAGGVDIVSLYVIWIHHEEIHGQFDFTGDRCLRDFLETVKKCGMYCILRIGPWAHGEARNGGFPDWLLEDAKEKDYEVRTDAPAYLEHVRRFYEKTYEQAEGYFIQDDGPIIGIQIENEYGHCGGKTGDEGEQHMRTLKAMAQEIGFITPIYTATGWGGAVTGGMLPVMGGYCEAPWDPRTTEIEPSGNYIFTRERNDHNIGSDHGLGAGITFDMDKFPFLTAELGGGLQVTHHRRPIASGLDTAAMSMVKLGCGANLLGYYMYHGGTNPKGKLTTLQETTATGYPNDLPEYSYDFNAPLREYGQMEDTFREVRLLATFVRDFGSDICDMAYTEQPGNPLKPENLTDLRTSVRYKKVKDSDGGEIPTGYLFVNNYQRRYEMARHEGVELNAYAEDGKTALATFAKRDVENGDFFFYPFNMPVGESARLTIDSTPVCILRNIDEEHHSAYVFYTDTDRDYSADVTGDLSGNKIIVLTREEAVHSCKVTLGGREHLIISDSEAVTNAEGQVELYFETSCEGRPGFKIYPQPEKVSAEFACQKEAQQVADFADSDAFAVYEGTKTYASNAKASFELVSEDQDKNTYEIRVTGCDEAANEILMKLDYTGDGGKISLDGQVIADSFYTGQLWEVGIKRFLIKNSELEIKCEIMPLLEGAKLYLQQWPQMQNGRACGLKGISLVTEYRTII